MGMRLIAALAAMLCLCSSSAQADPVTFAVIGIATEVFGVAVSAETAFAIAVLTPYALGGAVLLGSSILARSLLKSPGPDAAGGGKVPGPSETQATLKQPVAPRRRHYGRVKVGGILDFYSARDGKLYALIMVAQGEIESFSEHWLNEKIVTLDGSGFVQDYQYLAAGADIAPPDNEIIKTPRVQIVAQQGFDDQVAHPVLLADFPDLWTSAHQLKGVSNVLCVFKTAPSVGFSDIYPQGAPTYRAVILAAKVYDPRDGAQDPSDKGTWVWSDNAALCILDYLTHADGMGRSRDLFDVASFIAAANACDEEVELAAGGTEPRYRLNGSYDLNERPSEVLKRMLAVCDGEIYQVLTTGKYGLRVGVKQPSNATITNKDVLTFEMAGGSDALAAFNQIKIVYCSPDHDDQEAEGQPWEDTDNIALVGEVRSDDLHLPMCQSHSQARRLAKITMYRGNPRWKGTVRTNLSGLRAVGSRIVRIQLDELDIDETFHLDAISISPDLSFCDLNVSSLPEEAYDWDAATEEGSPAVPANPIETLAYANRPTNFYTHPIPAGGSNEQVEANWDLVGPLGVGFVYEIQYRYFTDNNWTVVYPILEGVNVWDGPIMVAGDTYFVRIRSVSLVTGIASDWSPIDSCSFS